MKIVKILVIKLKKIIILALVELKLTELKYYNRTLKIGMKILIIYIQWQKRLFKGVFFSHSVNIIGMTKPKIPKDISNELFKSNHFESLMNIPSLLAYINKNISNYCKYYTEMAVFTQPLAHFLKIFERFRVD